MVDFVEICNVCVRKVIIEAAKRIINSDKVCHSYSDLNFGVIFLEHSVETENSQEGNDREKEVSFEAVPKNSQCWSRGEVGWQTVPEATSSHWKRRIVCSCAMFQTWPQAHYYYLTQPMTLRTQPKPP